MISVYTEVPTGPKITLSDQDLAVVAQSYGLGTILGKKLLDGAVNTVVLLRTSQGEFVARAHRPWTTAERLESVHTVMQSLKDRGFPVPEVCRTLDNRTWIQIRDRLVELQEYIPHEGCVDGWDLYLHSFEMLAKMHEYLLTLQVDHLFPPTVSTYVTPEQALKMLEDTEDLCAEKIRESGIEDAMRIRQQAKEILEVLDREWKGYADRLPRQVVHGDYGWDNVLVKSGRIVGIIDFDFMAERERVFEVAYSLYWAFDRLEGDNWEKGFFPRVGRLVDRYNYLSRWPLLDVEISVLPYEMARVPLYWIAEAGYTPDPVEQIMQYSRHLPRARRLVELAG